MNQFLKNKAYAVHPNIAHKAPWISIILLIGSLLLTQLGIHLNRDYVYYKEVVIPITARVTGIREVDDEGGTDYSVLISYSYNGVSVSNAYYETLSNKTKSIGDTVTVMIDPKNPKYIFRGETGMFAFAFASIALAAMMHLMIEWMHRLRRTSSENVPEITEEMVADDLKPLMKTFWGRSLTFVGLMFVTGRFVIPNLFGFGSIFMGTGILIAGIFIFFNVLSNVQKIPERPHQLLLDTCKRQWSEYEGEDMVYFTNFSRLGTVCGRYGRIGERYHIVKDRVSGRICGLYNVELWQPAIQEPELFEGSRKVLRNLWIDFGIIVLAAIGYIGCVALLLKP